MQWSYRILTVFGIQIRVHITFLLIVAYFAFVWGAVREPGGTQGALYGVLLVVLLFGLVTVHELTHSRVAQAYGVQVQHITLLPIGGMAAMSEIPQDPRKELAISVAGPLSNVVMAVFLVLAAVALGYSDQLTSWSRFSTVMLEMSFRGTLLYLIVINLSLAIFNLLPAFPMDGGRVFRALLALKLGRAHASRIAVGVGQVFALLMGIGGFLTGNFLLVLVAVFIYFGAQAEGSTGQLITVLGDLRVRQAVHTAVEVASPDQVIGQLAARLFHTYQEDFPVVDEDGAVVGLVTRDRLIASLGEHGPDHPVSLTMRREFPVGRLDDKVYDAFMRMRAEQVKAMPVMDEDRLIGMLSLEDISEVYALLAATGPDFARRVPPVAGGPVSLAGRDPR